MKYLLIVSLFLMACAKPSNVCNNPTGTAMYNTQQVNLINGGCSVTYTPATVNGIAVQSATICGMFQGYVYNKILYNPGMPSTSTPTGFATYSDTYIVFPQGASTQCWYKVTAGQIDAGADNPTF